VAEKRERVRKGLTRTMKNTWGRKEGFGDWGCYPLKSNWLGGGEERA